MWYFLGFFFRFDLRQEIAGIQKSCQQWFERPRIAVLMFLDKFSIAISSVDSLSFRKIVFWLDILAIGKFNVDVWVLA